ncbi:MAG: TIGR04282 family arsenosugar biosynthesis glycosyltransferase [Candidatus Binatia bacterium]|nr:TIGR04282 family arsenosugar biosynthesis glycosyltransferase [Candidatus Binatia bacterium]
MMPCRIVIFAKAPMPGKLKTRLIPVLGPAGAARLAHWMLIHTVRQALAARLGAVELCVAPSPSDPAWSDALPRTLAATVSWEDQGTGNLGDKLARAAARVTSAGQVALLVGSDCPALTALHLRQAARLMIGRDAVLVPSCDGGYVLLGLQRTHPSVFADIAWSTPSVAKETRARLTALGWRWVELPPLPDIDEPKNLVAVPSSWIARAARTQDSSPARPRVS